MSDKRKPKDQRFTSGKQPAVSGQHAGAEDRRQAVRSLRDEDAVRDDPYATIIPQGVARGTSAATHETSDAGVKVLLVPLGIVLGLIVVALLLVRVMTGVLAGASGVQPRVSVSVTTAAPPQAVDMRANPLTAWQHYQAAAEAVLTTYGWVDQKAGIARIPPIERAMTLLTEGVQPALGGGAPAATP